MTQTETKVFSSGLELASLLVSPGILPSLCQLISELYAETPSNQNLFWKKVTYEETGLIIIIFGTSQNHVHEPLLPFSMDMDENPFKFICSKTNPNFSLNQSAFSLLKQYGTQLDQLKSEIDLKKPVIVTGRGAGGSIASLFNLWLLEKMEPRTHKFPLCITFGSPLIGDQNFQTALSQSSNWNYCFLHVAYLKDPLIYSSISKYHPFGIFLLCSENGSSCFESSVSILNLLNLMSQLYQGLLQQNCDYGIIVENLNGMAIRKDFDVPKIPHSYERQANLTLQLWALGFPQLLQVIQQENDLESLVKQLDSQEVQLIRKRMKRFVPNKKLNDMKIYMANLEWYKKMSKKAGIGYYNRFKNDNSQQDQDVVMYSKLLNKYWEEMVEEVEKQPQKEGAAFRTRWLFAGTNYRRMVEPLYIAHYYREGKRDYINKGRPDYYRKLEEWLEDEKKPHDSSTTKQNIQSILTMDSCFWAHVEEAVILTQKLKAKEYNNEAERQEAMNGLVEFERYVYKLLKNYSVSPEIFLYGSSFMHWWGNVITINEASHDYEFENFMKNRANYEKYTEGAYNFP